MVSLALAIFSALLISQNALAHPTQRTIATVLYVTDGDTIKVKINGRKESVRLIGIDAPESRANDRAYKQALRSRADLETILALGKQSKQFLSQRLPASSTVQLEEDVQPRDRYGRLLAYVYLPNGMMVNEEILISGYASVLTIPPNVRYVERFTRAAKEARKAKRGLWTASGFAP
jgi:micrococcal nuclease